MASSDGATTEGSNVLNHKEWCADQGPADGEEATGRKRVGTSGLQPKTSKYTVLRRAMRLSMLCCADREDLTAWREGGTTKEVPLTDCTSFKPDEVEPVHLALEGEDAESGMYRMAQWLMAKADGVLYVAFRGTWNIDEALLNAHSIQLDSGVRLHSGFNTRVNDEVEMILAKCQEERSNVQRVVLTGHSLGGAYAIAALLKLSGAQDLPPLAFEAITFGAPLVVVSPPSKVPPILNVVANYDIVPRLLAMPDEEVNGFVQHASRLSTDSWNGAAVAQFAVPAAERITRAAHDRRRYYRPVGTFLFAQSHVAHGSVRTSATSVPSDDAAKILKKFPEVGAGTGLSSAQERSDFVRGCVEDHSTTGYWRTVQALCDGKELPSGCPRDLQLKEKAIVNQLKAQITVAVPEDEHFFDVESGGQVSLKLFPPSTKITASSTLLGDTTWNIEVPASGSLLIHESNLLGYVARTYSATDDGWEMGPVVSPHDARGGHVDQLAALLNRRYPEGTTAVTAAVACGCSLGRNVPLVTLSFSCGCSVDVEACKARQVLELLSEPDHGALRDAAMKSAKRRRIGERWDCGAGAHAKASSGGGARSDISSENTVAHQAARVPTLRKRRNGFAGL